MTAPTVYYSDDAGVPALSANSADRFYEIVRACLIDGYSGKAAAGWSVVYDDWLNSGVATFANAGGSGVVGIVRASNNNYQPFLFIADAMVDAASPVNGRSGYAAIDSLTGFSDASKVFQRPMHYNTEINYWTVVATENTAIFCLSSVQNEVHGITTTTINSNTALVGFGSFGDLRGLGSSSQPIIGNFSIIGGARGSEYILNGANSAPADTSIGTVSRGVNNVIFDGNAFAALDLITQAYINYTPYRTSDSIVELNLSALSLYATDDSSSGWRLYCYQRAQISMIKSHIWLTSANYTGGTLEYYSRMSISATKETIYIASKPHLVCWAPATILLFISLAEEDWL